MFKPTYQLSFNWIIEFGWIIEFYWMISGCNRLFRLDCLLICSIVVTLRWICWLLWFTIRSCPSCSNCSCGLHRRLLCPSIQLRLPLWICCTVCCTICFICIQPIRRLHVSFEEMNNKVIQYWFRINLTYKLIIFISDHKTNCHQSIN